MLNCVGKRATTFTNPIREIEGYMLVDANITFDITQYLFVSLQVKNLLDTENYDPGVRTANETSRLAKIEQTKRCFYVKLGLNF